MITHLTALLKGIFNRSLLLPSLIVLCTLSCTSKKDPSEVTLAEKKTLNLFIWSNYVSDESLKEFEKESNIKVNVTQYASNEEVLAKLLAGASGYDIAVPSYYIVSAMINLGLLEPIDKSIISNREKLDTKLLGKDFDPKNEYSLPYGWASTGIAINKKFFPEGLKSWKEFLENPKLKGHIALLDDIREVFGIALKINGQSINVRDEKVIQEAQKYLLSHKAQIKAYLSDPMEAMLNGEVWASQMFSSDALQASFKTKGQIEYVIPTEGATFSIDNLVILKSSKNKLEAHKLLNYLISPANNKRFVQKMFAGPILLETKAALPLEYQTNKGLFPSDETLKKMEMLKDLGPAATIYDRFWTELKTQ